MAKQRTDRLNMKGKAALYFVYNHNLVMPTYMVSLK